MLWLAIALPLSFAEAVVKPAPLGVTPHLASRYVPLKSDSGLWKCLDGSKDIPWKAVNDDYCDCPDGSDEPGLSIE
jgi:protein kinase C substrate 80K-H